MLTQEEMNDIINDEVLGKPQRHTSAEAKAFLKEVKPQIAAAQKAGYQVAVPNEIEVGQTKR